jgi:SAM-dependent methyltransferase
MTAAPRSEAYGQGYVLSPADRLGVWLSGRAIRGAVRDFTGLRVGDFGCGYQAALMRSILPCLRAAVLADVALAPDLAADPKVTCLIGYLPGVLASLPDASLNVVLCMSVLEHLWEPVDTLREFRRVTTPGGVVLLNVPSWRGKRFLEFSAFRLGLSPAAEMNDHKAYYDPRDLWPLLVRAGFRPQDIRVYTHKFGLNTFAICRCPAA